jgi:hypothetical protein
MEMRAALSLSRLGDAADRPPLELTSDQAPAGAGVGVTP